jgi:hypothetical protein
MSVTRSAALRKEAPLEAHADGSVSRGKPAESVARVSMPPSIENASRHVTGVFSAMLEEAGVPLASQRIWYAAIGDRPRGPFSAAELVILTEKGKVRPSTLLWKSGMTDWNDVATLLDASSDVVFLEQPMGARRRREALAQEQARAEHQANVLSIPPAAVAPTPPPAPVHASAHSPWMWAAAIAVVGASIALAWPALSLVIARTLAVR